MSYGFALRVWGDYACFSRPEFKVERVSYDFITPSAARGFIEAIYWKPAIKWHIDKIHIINPIKFTNIRRNEVQNVISLASIKKAVNGKTSYEIEAPAARHQKAAMLLKDVEYVLEFHFEMVKEKAGESDTEEKHYNIALRRMRNGQFFQAPFFGTREFGGSFELIENGDIPKSQLKGENDFGFMLYDLNYTKEGEEKIHVSPKFFRARAFDGICDLTQVEEVFS